MSFSPQIARHVTDYVFSRAVLADVDTMLPRPHVPVSMAICRFSDLVNGSSDASYTLAGPCEWPPSLHVRKPLKQSGLRTTRDIRRLFDCSHFYLFSTS